MNHPRCAAGLPAAIALSLVSASALAAPTVTPGPAVELCAAPCTPIGGVGLAGDRIGILIDDAGAATWIELDRTTGAELSSTVLGNSAGFQMQDVAPDGAGGAWLVGFADSGSVSTPGRWHTSDLVSRDTPAGLGGTADLRLFAVATDGTAFGVSDGDFATRLPTVGGAISMVTGLSEELPTSVFSTTADGSASVGDAQAAGLLTLAVWDGDTLAFQDSVAGGNGVIGTRDDDTLVVVGIRIGGGGAELAAFVDPLGTPTLMPITPLMDGELAGMDRYGFGFAYGAVEGDAAIIDTNDMDVLMLGDIGLGGFESLVAMDYLGGSDWLLVLRGSTHYSLATITTGDIDSDGDGVGDATDNCRETPNPTQLDADADLFGNICDADFNNDCIVNALDLGILRLNFFSANPVTDMTGDGITNAIDLGQFKARFFQPPGPGAPGNDCE